MTDHSQLAVARAAPVNVAVAASHRSGSRTKICARDIDQRFAESGAAGLVANEGRKDVAFLQKESAGDADCFLSFADVNPASNPAAAIHAGEFLFERSRQQHPAKRLNIFFVDRRFRWGFLLRSRRLQHRTIVANIRAAAQKIFVFSANHPEIAAGPPRDLVLDELSHKFAYALPIYIYVWRTWFRVAHASRVLVSASRRNDLPRRVRESETLSP